MINYAIKKCANPNGIEGVDYYTPRVVKTSDYDMEELVGDINDATVSMLLNCFVASLFNS